MSKKKGIIAIFLIVFTIVFFIGVMYRYFSYKQRKYINLDEEWTLYRYDQWNKETSEIGVISIEKEGEYNIHVQYNDKSCDITNIFGPKKCDYDGYTYYFNFSDNFDIATIEKYNKTKIKDVFVVVSDNPSFINNNKNRLKVINQNGNIKTNMNWQE